MQEIIVDCKKCGTKMLPIKKLSGTEYVCPTCYPNRFD